MKTMKRMIHVLLMLFFMSSSVYADEFQDAVGAYDRSDFKIAFEKFKPLATQGNSAAQYNLGLMYQYGESVNQDFKEASKWYKLSAKQGYAPAQNNLGVRYEKGEGVTQDYKEAVKWYKMAAEQRDSILIAATAQKNLGGMYVNGKGVAQDNIQAHKWLNIAAANGNKDGRERRDIVEKRMTPDQIAEAQKLARNWKPTTK